MNLWEWEKEMSKPQVSNWHLVHPIWHADVFFLAYSMFLKLWISCWHLNIRGFHMRIQISASFEKIGWSDNSFHILAKWYLTGAESLSRGCLPSVTFFITAQKLLISMNLGYISDEQSTKLKIIKIIYWKSSLPLLLFHSQ